MAHWERVKATYSMDRTEGTQCGRVGHILASQTLIANGGRKGKGRNAGVCLSMPPWGCRLEPLFRSKTCTQCKSGGRRRGTSGAERPSGASAGLPPPQALPSLSHCPQDSFCTNSQWRRRQDITQDFCSFTSSYAHET